MKFVDLFVTRPSEFKLWGLVERDEVDLAGDTLYEVGKTKGIPGRIVDAIDEDVFENSPLPRAEAKPSADFKDLLQWIGFVDRHEKAAGVIIRCVEGNGPLKAEFRRYYSLHGRNEPRGGEGNTSPRETEA